MHDVLHDDMLYLRGKNAILFVYNQKKKTAYIPNEEIREELMRILLVMFWQLRI